MERAAYKQFLGESGERAADQKISRERGESDKSTFESEERKKATDLEILREKGKMRVLPSPRDLGYA